MEKKNNSYKFFMISTYTLEDRLTVNAIRKCKETFCCSLSG